MSTTEHGIDTADLEEVVGRMVLCGRVKATYAAGAWVRHSHGAERMLSVGIVNPRDRDAAEAGLAGVAGAAAEWLAARGLAVAGTRISIHLLREVDLMLVSWAWGRGGATFWIDAAGELTASPPVESGEAED